jgi:hypothetical protein
LPTKDFYEKKDVRGSYFHEFVLVNGELRGPRKIEDFLGYRGRIENVECIDCISEYELTKYLMDEFGFEGLKSEDEYIQYILNGKWKKENVKCNGLEKISDELYRKKVFDESPYKNGFFTENGKFNFLTEKFERIPKNIEIVTAKENKALNSQFLRDENIYINPKSKDIMLNWITKNLDFRKDEITNKVRFSNDIPENVIFTKGGSIINSALKCNGENAYYEID